MMDIYRKFKYNLLENRDEKVIFIINSKKYIYIEKINY